MELFSPEIKNRTIANHVKGKAVRIFANRGKENFAYPDFIGQKAVVLECDRDVEVEINGQKIRVGYHNLDPIIPRSKYDAENFKAWYQARNGYWINKKDRNNNSCPSKACERIGDIYWKCKQIFSKVEMLHIEEIVFCTEHYSMDDVYALRESVIILLEGR